MINGSPLNSGPLNTLRAGAAPQPEPEYRVHGTSYVWRVRLLVGGVDMTAILTGQLDVDREEGAAAVAGFSLYLAPGQPVVPTQWIGKAVTLDYISRDRYGVVTEARLYTGLLELPTWDATTRVLGCECSDQLQQRIEGLTLEQIDTLCGGTWSADVFEPVDGRSHWDYAVERMSTRPASLDADTYGNLRTTSWYAAATPHFVFGSGQTLDGSVQIELQAHGGTTNYVEITLDYRYSRLWQLNQRFGWTHTGTGGFTGLQGFCMWRRDSTELPTTEMVEAAVTGAGLQMIGAVGGYKLPLGMPNPCGDGIPWVNTFDNLWLSASAVGARRWVQTVTEQYKLALFTPLGAEEATRVINRESTSFEVESERADDWEQGKALGESRSEDLIDDSRRGLALECLLQRGSTSLVSAHRGTSLSWQVPTDMALSIDLVHTLELGDRAQGKGKCRRIQHVLDLGEGTAITTLDVALMQGGGESDPLSVPGSPDTTLPPVPGNAPGLGTHIGGRVDSPPFDETWLGFTGNYSVTTSDETYPRNFRAKTHDILAEYRDERTATAERSYRVGIPDDLLEL
ncbi:hypothetical protein [Pseudomonas sp. PA27(2017)]|uniref:hypothetical protein n=1 Tax=Pseudomonas sp. PA27(2017) TaxID=1932112 RepID=UPI000965DC50|nr:hypothetical protein [Pseudomonas sp. PA27(2017)]OLU23878.1 hypothetical protein BVH06_22140 [Pseudomonas sp. PA27(2017)]